MLSVRSSPHRLHQRNRLFAPSAGSWSLKIGRDGEKQTYGCVEKIRLVLGVWVYEVVMRFVRV